MTAAGNVHASFFVVRRVATIPERLATKHPPAIASIRGEIVLPLAAFEKLNDKDTARILYKKLIATYKDSPEAQQAQQKLN